MDSVFHTMATLSYWALNIYEWVLIIAILITWVNPDPRNPIVQFLSRMTQPLWDYLSARLPSSLRLFSAYVSLLLIWFLKIFVPGTFNTIAVFSVGRLEFGDVPPRILGFFLLGGGVVLQNLLFFLIVLLLVWFFLTLVSPSVNNPIVRTVYFLVDPFITPFQKRLPRMSMDFSPLLAAGVLLLLNMFVVSQLIFYSAGLTRYANGIPETRPVNLPVRSVQLPSPPFGIPPDLGVPPKSASAAIPSRVSGSSPA